MAHPQEAVRQLLGKPFSKSNENVACDWFSKSDGSWNDFLGWDSVYVCYDKDHKVNFRS